MAGTQFGDLPVDPAAAWDALSWGGKGQIIGFIGFLEFHSELTKPHVTKGGVPGQVKTRPPRNLLHCMLGGPSQVFPKSYYC